MVLSNTKLKRKKREEAAAITALAPPPDSNATPSSETSSKRGAPAVESAKKKRRKAKKPAESNGHSENGAGGMDIDDAQAKSTVSAAQETTMEETITQTEQEQKPKKRQKKNPQKTVAPKEVTVGAEKQALHLPAEGAVREAEAGKKDVKAPSDGADCKPEAAEKNGKAPYEGAVHASETGSEDVKPLSEAAVSGVTPEGNAVEGQTEEAPKPKIRVKPRWPKINGKRVKPGTVVGEDSIASGEAPSASDKGAEKNGNDKALETPSAAAAVVDVVQSNDRIIEGDEPWLESGKKKKKKLADGGEKKAKNGAAVEAELLEDQGASQDARSQEEKVDPKKVMVGGMPYYITEDDIHEFFQECGTISELDCMIFPDTGKFRGIVFITFRTEEAAKRALALDGTDMGGRFLKIEKCKIKPKEPAKKEVYQEPPKKYDGCLSAYIGNLDWNVTEKELRKFFKDSKIEAIRFAVDKETGEPRGFGHVDFADDESLESALKLDQMEVLGRPIKIAYSVAKRIRTGEGEARGQQLEQPKKKSCFTCGEGGHMSYNCPKKPLP